MGRSSRLRNSAVSRFTPEPPWAGARGEQTQQEPSIMDGALVSYPIRARLSIRLGDGSRMPRIGTDGEGSKRRGYGSTDFTDCADWDRGRGTDPQRYGGTDRGRGTNPADARSRRWGRRDGGTSTGSRRGTNEDSRSGTRTARLNQQIETECAHASCASVHRGVPRSVLFVRYVCFVVHSRCPFLGFAVGTALRSAGLVL